MVFQNRCCFSPGTIHGEAEESNPLTCIYYLNIKWYTMFMSERIFCPAKNLPCESEGYCAIWKDLITTDTHIEARLSALSRATLTRAAKIERVYGYCAEDRLAVAQETLDDTSESDNAKLGASISLDSITRRRKSYLQS